jgi:anti-sigma B factor antagonist
LTPRHGTVVVTLQHGPLTDFGVSVKFAGDRVVVAVGGEVDLVSAPELSAIADAVIERGHVRVVLDLAEMTFINTTGLSNISAIADRIASSGGELTVRAAPLLLARVLGVSELAEVVRFEDAVPILVDHLGPEQSGKVQGGPVKVGSPDAAVQLRQVMAIPADHDVVDGALRLVVSLTRATVEGADGVSVSLQRHGRLHTVAASDQTISEMDADQYATGEGPCVDASVQGHWFHVESLEQEGRWVSSPSSRTQS